MSFGYGFGLPSWQTLSGGFNPSSLFVGGVQGTWYDPSDASTLFSDTAGTTPSPTPGAGALSVVGLMLDKSQNGVGTNGAYRYNLLTYSEQFDNAYWSNYQIRAWGSGSVVNATTAPDGTTTADLAVENTANDAHVPFFRGSAASAGSYTFSIYAKAYAGSLATRYLALRMFVGVNNFLYYTFDLASASFDAKAGSASTFTNISASSTDVGSGWRRLSLSFTCAGTLDPLGTQISNVASPTLVQLGTLGAVSYTGDNTSGIYIWGAQLTTASAPTAYQRIDANWYSTMAGNHAISYNTTTARPELSARVNLLTYSEQFDNAGWTKTSGGVGSDPTIIPNTTVAPDGTTTADTYTQSTSSNARLFQTITTVSGTVYTHSIYVKKNVGQWLRVLPIDTATQTNGFNAYFDLNNGVVGTTGTIGTGAVFTSASITAAANGFWRITITGSIAASSIQALFCYVAQADNNTARLDNGSVFLWGADLRPANIGTGVPAYQRIADQYTYDSSGFPRYLVFNGTASGMYTPANLNLSGTDKATVFAGVRKLDNTNVNQLMELSSTVVTNAGAFSMPTNATVAGSWTTFMSGSSTFVSASAAGTTAPITTVNAGLYDIALSADEAKLRINGAQVATSGASNAGTGNFGSYPLNIGVRSATATPSLFLNGYLYSLIVVGAASTAAQISSTESWINVKEGTVY